jgi:hypothetical protein
MPILRRRSICSTSTEWFQPPWRILPADCTMRSTSAAVCSAKFINCWPRARASSSSSSSSILEKEEVRVVERVGFSAISALSTLSTNSTLSAVSVGSGSEMRRCPETSFLAIAAFCFRIRSRARRRSAVSTAFIARRCPLSRPAINLRMNFQISPSLRRRLPIKTSIAPESSGIFALSIGRISPGATSVFASASMSDDAKIARKKYCEPSGHVVDMVGVFHRKSRRHLPGSSACFCVSRIATRRKHASASRLTWTTQPPNRKIGRWVRDRPAPPAVRREGFPQGRSVPPRLGQHHERARMIRRTSATAGWLRPARDPSPRPAAVP